MTAHSRAARKLRRELDAELQENARGSGDEVFWTAAEKVILERIACTVDHITDLTIDYRDAQDSKTRVMLSGEIRLLDGSLSRLLAKIRTEIAQPAKESRATQRARRAAQIRWGTREGEENAG